MKRPAVTYQHRPPRRQRPPTWVIVLVSTCALAVAMVFYAISTWNKYVIEGIEFGDEVVLVPTETVVPAASDPSSTAAPTTVPTTVPVTLPASVLLSVPFTSQAPNGNWDPPYDEACEEASLIMVRAFLQEEALTKASADEKITALTTWEGQNGYAIDITIQELSSVARDFYGMKTGRVIQVQSAAVIKKELAAGRPVIVPAAGQLLPNPNFQSPGPPYHMLVVTGYDRDGFITNDPGTRRGEGFRYTERALMEAIHNWNGSTSTITSGAKVALVFD